MGKLDDEMYVYLSNRETFADLVNAGCFGGKQVVNGKCLEMLSERVQAEKVVQGKKYRKGKAGENQEDEDREKGSLGKEILDEESLGRGSQEKELPQVKNYYRDIRMKLPDGTLFKILAAENQSMIDYEMPLRIMMRDGAEYEEQLKKLHQEKRKARGGKRNPILEKMDKKDRLCPVYTICFYHGEGKWTGPCSLRDMMDFGQEDRSDGGKDDGQENATEYGIWERVFCDYPMIVINAEDENLSAKCKTELRQFLQAMQARREPKKLEELFVLDEYNHLSYETARTIAVMTGMAEYLKNMEENKTEEGDGYTMCTAIREIRKESREEGRELTMLEVLRNSMQSLQVSSQRAMEILGVPMEEREKYRKKLGDLT